MAVYKAQIYNMIFCPLWVFWVDTGERVWYTMSEVIPMREQKVQLQDYPRQITHHVNGVTTVRFYGKRGVFDDKEQWTYITMTTEEFEALGINMQSYLTVTIEVEE